MANDGKLPTVSVDELKRALAADGTPRRKGVTEDEKQEFAFAVLHTMRGLSKRDKRSVLRRADKLLSH